LGRRGTFYEVIELLAQVLLMSTTLLAHCVNLSKILCKMTEMVPFLRQILNMCDFTYISLIYLHSRKILWENSIQNYDTFVPALKNLYISAYFVAIIGMKITKILPVIDILS
jgi:hypothetical protein